jgi:hypothetical protein
LEIHEYKLSYQKSIFKCKKLFFIHVKFVQSTADKTSINVPVKKATERGSATNENRFKTKPLKIRAKLDSIKSNLSNFIFTYESFISYC